MGFFVYSYTHIFGQLSVDLGIALADTLLVIGFVAIGLSMWFSFKQKETTKPKEIQSDEEE